MLLVNQFDPPKIPSSAVVASGGVFALSLLAHQGGWDEILLVAAPMAFVGWLLWVAKKRMSRAAPPTADGGPGAEPVPGTGERADHAD